MDTFYITGFNENSKNKDEAYVVTNLDSDKTKIVLYDLKKNAVIKEISSNPVYAVSSISLAGKNRNYELDCINYEGEREEVISVSKFYKEVHNQLKSEFRDKDFFVVSSDDNDNKLLVVVSSSDKLYGTYYECNTKTKKTKLLYDLMSQLKPEDMAE